MLSSRLFRLSGLSRLSLRRFVLLLVAICCWPAIAAADEARVIAALAKPVDVDFQNTPLRDVVEFLGTQAGVPIALDVHELERAEIPPDVPVTRRLKQHPLRSTLAILLRPLGLSFVPRDDHVLVTTLEGERGLLRLRVISVETWLRPADEDSDLLQRELIEYLYLAGFPEPGWKRDGGVGSLRLTAGGALALSTTWRTHGQIDALLRALRSSSDATAVPPGDFRPTVIPVAPADPRISKLLDEPLDVEFENTSWADVQRFFEARCRMPVLFPDNEAAPAAVTFRSRGRSLRRTLDELARAASLEWTLADDALYFTELPEGEVEQRLSIRLYCIADLAPGDDREAVRDALDELQELILAMTGDPGPGWIDGGGSGVVLPLSLVKTLAVRTTEDVHRQIEELLTGLRRERLARPAAAPAKKPLVTRRYSVVTQAGTDEAKLRKRVAWIQATIAPESWGHNGCRLQIVEDEVIVTHRSDVHRRIERLMPSFGSAAWYRASGVF